MAGKNRLNGSAAVAEELPAGGDAPAKGGKKTSCPVSRKQFREKAPKFVPVTIGDRAFSAGLKEFSTGSLGFNLNDKTVIEIDGIPTPFQIGVNITAIGSRELPEEG